MRTILDTDVVSQLSKRPPNPAVATWILDQREENLFLSAITIFEIRFGIETVSSPKRRAELEKWVDNDLYMRFDGRVLSIDEHVANTTGQIMARSQREGWNMKHMDAFIGASAMVFDMRLATLNRKDFRRLPVELVEFDSVQ